MDRPVRRADPFGTLTTTHETALAAAAKNDGDGRRKEDKFENLRHLPWMNNKLDSIQEFQTAARARPSRLHSHQTHNSMYAPQLVCFFFFLFSLPVKERAFALLKASLKSSGVSAFWWE